MSTADLSSSSPITQVNIGKPIGVESGQKLYEYMSPLSSQARTLIVKRMIQVAIEKDTTEREVCLNIFKEAFVNDLIRKEEIRRGFDLIYIDLDDILIDIPHAIEYLMQMVIRIVYDYHMFSESFFARIPEVLLGLKMYPRSRIII